MTEYTISEKCGMIFLTREERIPSGDLTLNLSKSIILEKDELSTLLKVISDYANKTGSERV